MIQSMTGFGKAIALLSIGKLAIEIQSVNRRFLEISVSLPQGLAHLEADIRREVTAKISRGFVTIRVHLSHSKEGGEISLPPVDRLRSLKESWESLADELGYSKNCIDLSFLLSRIPQEELEMDLPFSLLKKTLLEALEAFVHMRKKEGSAILQEIQKRINLIADFAKQIRKKAPQAVEVIRSKLKARLADLFPKEQELEERVLREAAILAEKSDVTEEIERLESHLNQFHKLSSQGDGKKMDFLVQEMGREVHTIGSKINDLEITRFVVDLKGELEKVREQVQNIE